MSTTILLNILLERGLRRLQIAKVFVEQGVADTGWMLYGHGDGDSRMKLPWPSTKSSPSESRISTSLDSLAQPSLFHYQSLDSSLKYMEYLYKEQPSLLGVNDS